MERSLCCGSMDGLFDPRSPERFGQAVSGRYLSGAFSVPSEVRSTIGETPRDDHARNKQGAGPCVGYGLIHSFWDPTEWTFSSGSHTNTPTILDPHDGEPVAATIQEASKKRTVFRSIVTRAWFAETVAGGVLS